MGLYSADVSEESERIMGAAMGRIG